MRALKFYKNYATKKLHLEVPQAPVKKLLKIRTRAVKVTTTGTTPSTDATTATTTVRTTKICWALSTAVNSIKRRNKNRLLRRSSSRMRRRTILITKTISEEEETKVVDAGPSVVEEN